MDQLIQARNGLVVAQLNFINPILNPSEKDYLSYYLEDNNFIYFNNQTAEDEYLFAEEYTINSDNSLFVFPSNHTDLGFEIPNLATKSSFIPLNTSNKTLYGSFNILKSGIINTYTRSFYTINEWLSYIGGLFGTLSVIAIVFGIYN